MKYELWLPKDRAEYVLNYIPKDKVKKLNEVMDGFNLEFTIYNHYDLLQVFHAGIHYGLKILK